MPLDTNFMVVSLILAGLTIWAITQKADTPPERNTYIYNAGFDAPDDVEMEAVLGKKPEKDARAPAIKDAIIRRYQYLSTQRSKFDGQMRDISGTATVADLERKHGALAQELRYTIAQCSNWAADFVVWKSMLVQMDEGEWVKLHLIELNSPTAVRQALEAYEQSVSKTLNVSNFNQLNVAQRYDTMPQDQGDFSKLNANQRFNVEADDTFMVDKAAQKPGTYQDYSRGGYIGSVFQNVDSGDDVTIETAQAMHGQTVANPQRGASAHQRTQTNTDAFNTLNQGGVLGSGNMDDRADDHDMRDQNFLNQKAKGGDATTLVGGEVFTKAKTNETNDDLSPAPYMQAPNEQITADAKQLAARVAELEKAAKVKEVVAEDGNQDLGVGQSGGIPKGVPVAQAAVYQAPEATPSQANETDAIPKKPVAKAPAASSGGPVVKPVPLPGFESIGEKRKRDTTGVTENPFVAVKIGSKKTKYPALPPAVMEDIQDELDLTGGTKRGGTDPELGPERRGDLEASENDPIQLTGPSTGTVTEEPLGGGGKT